MKQGHTLVIGYGNPLRGDDGIGWEVAARLAARNDKGPIEVIIVPQLTPELAEPISLSNLVIFLDASREGVAGEWRCHPLPMQPASDGAFCHHVDAAGLLAYARNLFHANPRAVMISVTGESFECRETLTPRIEAVVPEIIDYIHDRLIALNS